MGQQWSLSDHEWYAVGVDAAIDITTEERQTVLGLLQRHLPGPAAWVYGSRVKWTSTPKSDLDLVVFATPEQRSQVGDLRDAFDESNLPFRVDLFVWDDVPESFRKQIETEHVALEIGARQPLAEPCSRRTDEWRAATIDAIAASSPNAVVGGPFGSNLVSRDYVPEGVPVIRGQNMGARWVTGDFAFVTQEKADSLKANLTQPDDIVLTQRGTLGQVSIVPSALSCCLLSQSQMKVTIDRGIAEPLFFYYVLSSAEQQNYVRQNAIQTGVPHTNLGILRSTPVPVPPLREQRAIAHILGTLDDKIELNRRMNAKLEAMARALFRSWFVDFDPVRAKMEGRDTGLPKDIADLFPDRLVESELGEVPDGWALERLSEHCEAVKGVSYKGSGLEQDGVPLHNLNSIHEGGGYKYEGIKYYSGEYKDRHVVRTGDVIVANTEQGHDRLLIGYAAIVPGLFGDRGIYSHHVYRLRPRSSGHLSAPFLHLLLNSPWMHDVVSGYANGTTVNMLPMDAVQKPMVVVPPMALLEAFDALALRLQHRREQAVRDSRTLGVLRDALLPKLVCGELRVNTSEAAFGLWSADIGGNARDGGNAPA